MKSKLIILGCGSSVGVPRIDGIWGKSSKINPKNFRTRCSAIVIKGNNYILIDTSPDIRHQFLSNNIKKLSSIIFTHEHADQTNGLFEVRPFFWKNKKKIDAYGSKSTMLHIMKRQDYLFKNISGYPAILNSRIVKKEFTLGESKNKILFNTTNVKHGKINSTAYIFEKTAYISDCNDLRIIKNKNFQNLNYLVLDCLKLSKHPSHFNFREALFVHKMLKPKKTVLTNLHHDLDYKVLLKKLPKNIIPAFDGLVLNL
jgi:phosphoribosyl 1,2-cyclic phosphate phosphodiesterase